MGKSNKGKSSSKSNERYKLEGRRLKNKKRKAEKYRKHMEKCALRRLAREEANGLHEGN